MATASELAYRIDRLLKTSALPTALVVIAVGLVLTIASIAIVAALLPPASDPILMAPLRWSA